MTPSPWPPWLSPWLSPSLSGTDIVPLLTFAVASLALLAATCAWMLGRLDRAGSPAGSQAPDARPPRPQPTRSMAAMVALGSAVVVATGYGLWGTPAAWWSMPRIDAPGRGQAAEATSAPVSVELQAKVQAARQRTEREPRDADAWRELAQAHTEAQSFDDAEVALRAAVALRPGDLDLLTDLADVLAIGAGRRLQGEPLRLLATVLARDPAHVKALALTGIAAFEQGDAMQAVAHWERALAHAAPASPIALDLQAALPEARRRAQASGAPMPPPQGSAAPRSAIETSAARP
jgi:cytochrome c-type biogenesis protein CcmH